MHHPCHSATSACTLVATDRHLLHGRWRLAHHLLSSLRNRLCSLHLLGVIVPPPSCPLRFVRAPTSFQLVSRQPLWRRTARRLESRAALGASDLRCTPSDQNLTRVLIASVGHDCAFDRKPIHGGAYPLRLSLGGRWYCRIDAYLDMHLLYCTSSRDAGGDGHVSTQTMKR